MAPLLRDLYALLPRSSVNNDEPSSSHTSTFTRIGADKSLTARALQPITKRTQMINIPAIYSGPHTSPPIVVAIVLGTVIGFTAIAYLIYILVNKPKDIMSASSDIISDDFRPRKRRAPPRRRPTKPGPRKKPIIVDEDAPDEPDFVDVQDTSHMHGRYEASESIESPYSEETSESHYHHHGSRARHSPEMAESFYDPHSSRGGRRGR
ncbi:hypothetical protein FQN49_002140 [Arthroderma sp. PD_2]|nr:hypothetical protein FQN49_002140 [Arthroderma sp. PD_2]